MQLNKKKELAARTLNVGKSRISFNRERLDEIKEAITKQDIRDLIISRAITIKEVTGRRKIVKRTTRRKQGSKKKIVIDSKRNYMNLMRKLRAYLFDLKKKELISLEDYYKLRKEIRAGIVKSKTQIKERIKTK